MDHSAPADLVRHVAASTGLPPATAARVIADVLSYFGESTEEFIRRRHRELRGKQLGNERIWAVLGAELAARPVAAPELSARQLRRIVYG
ncbi:hypothetical protein EV191_102118 [Tamaricihabitans halophyticus]|uniref:Uncharacterized protein n=1 Tax=Tamaricihabitans halophyticus TaxID=1262583 RepID=A0A4R2R051_9PSEU|nr:hypothetical protein [Tamaricihabitans halophyticus]TCP54909.1 hypothetical protein EV191_102118 [Tamaricihabitans halophyticus]